MKTISRTVCVSILAGVLAGCGDPSGSDTSKTATPDNPQAGLDAIKQMQKPVDPKEAAKGTPKTPAK